MIVFEAAEHGRHRGIYCALGNTRIEGGATHIPSARAGATVSAVAAMLSEAVNACQRGAGSGSAWATSPWAAVQRAARDAFDKLQTGEPAKPDWTVTDDSPP